MDKIKKQFEASREMVSDVSDVIDSFIECNGLDQSACVATLTILLSEVMIKLLVANDNVDRSIHILEKVMNDAMNTVYEGGEVTFRKNYGKPIPAETEH